MQKLTFSSGVLTGSNILLLSMVSMGAGPYTRNMALKLAGTLLLDDRPQFHPFCDFNTLDLSVLFQRRETP